MAKLDCSVTRNLILRRRMILQAEPAPISRLQAFSLEIKKRMALGFRGEIGYRSPVMAI